MLEKSWFKRVQLNVDLRDMLVGRTISPKSIFSPKLTLNYLIKAVSSPKILLNQLFSNIDIS